MVVRLYVDTSIWRDYFEDRSDGIRPLGEFAFQFLKKCKEEKVQIIVSDVVLKELSLLFTETEFKIRISEFLEIIVMVERSKEQTAEALQLLEKPNRKFPLFDIVHAIIARDYNAVLISRDRHFAEIGICETGFPENFI